MKDLTMVASEFDEIALALASSATRREWSAAERFLLERIPATARTALDVGCGDGRMTRELAARAVSTVGVDISPGMLDVARRTSPSPFLEFREGDIMTESFSSAFDVVISVATVHHLPLELVIPRLAACVAPGGTLMIQDVVTRNGLLNLPVNGIAWAARRLRGLRFGAHSSPTVKALYDAHGEDEEYLLAHRVKRTYDAILPGTKIFHHLEWRYTAIWKATQ
jgi:SAM-dependent methyltransferase